jgi:glycosyltransferase involved in cell wall biosynthesis
MNELSVLEAVRRRFHRVAIVHDWLTIPGGSENVVLELLEIFPDADVFTSIYDPAPWPPAITSRPVHTTWLDRLPSARRIYPFLAPIMGPAFESFDLSAYDLVISSSHANAKNVHTPPGTPHVCYCHTPMRYAWDPAFLAGERIPPVVRRLLPPLLAWLRRRDLRGAARPDVFVANSRHVATRIERFYGRDSQIVYPPVDLDSFLSLPRRQDDHYLVLGRVVPYKRVDIAVQGAALAGRPVIVAGGGRALEDVRALGAPGATLLGRVSDERLRELLSGARALLFPGEEDFGIVPVEAQAAGVPVIAYGRGGAVETVADGVSGVLFEEQTAEGLAAAIRRFEALDLDPDAIRANARRFSRERFRDRMAAIALGAADGARESR